jgi:hypothetical protein
MATLNGVVGPLAVVKRYKTQHAEQWAMSKTGDQSWSTKEKLVGFAILAVLVLLYLAHKQPTQHEPDISAVRRCTDTRASDWQSRSPTRTISGDQINSIVRECLDGAPPKDPN